MEEKVPSPLEEYYAMYGPEAWGEKSLESEVEKLMREFESHETQEAKFVQRYKDVAAKTDDPFVKFVLGLIISDEEKHRTIVHAMATTLRADLTWTQPEGAIRVTDELRQRKDELLKMTEDFVSLEKQGIEVYKGLIRASEGYYRGLFGMLFQSMIHDSEKHVEILQFLRQKLKEA